MTRARTNLGPSRLTGAYEARLKSAAISHCLSALIVGISCRGIYYHSSSREIHLAQEPAMMDEYLVVRTVGGRDAAPT